VPAAAGEGDGARLRLRLRRRGSVVCFLPFVRISGGGCEARLQRRAALEGSAGGEDVRAGDSCACMTVSIFPSTLGFACIRFHVCASLGFHRFVWIFFYFRVMAAH
jgi:hypothetical protein